MMFSSQAGVPAKKHGNVQCRCGGPAADQAGKRIRDIGLCPEVHRLESTVRYLGIEVDDALKISEQVEL